MTANLCSATFGIGKGSYINYTRRCLAEQATLNRQNLEEERLKSLSGHIGRLQIAPDAICLS